MNKLLVILAFLIGSFTYGQVGIVKATKYLGITTIVRDGLIVNANEFPVIYNTTTGQFERYNGATWETWVAGDVTEADITDLQAYLLPADINTFTELDALVADETLVNTNDGQTLTNKTVDFGSNTLTNVASLNTAQTFTGQKQFAYGQIRLGGFTSGTLDLAAKDAIASGTAAIPNGNIVNEAGIATLTNKTIAGGSNTITGITGAMITDATIDELDLDASVNASLDLANSALQSEVDGSISNEIQTIDVSSLVGTVLNISLLNDGEATKTIELSSLQDGTGTDDQTAAEVTIADAGALITATTVEGALAENRTAIDLNTSKTSNATHTGEVTGESALTIASSVVDSDNIVNATIDEVDLDASVNASLDLADSAVQGTISGRTGTTVTEVMVQTQAQYTTDGAPSAGQIVFVSDATNNLDDLDDVTETSITTGDRLEWNGSAWVNVAAEVEVLTFHLSDFTTVQTGSTTVAKYTWRAPYAMTLTDIRGNVTTAGTTASITMDVHDGATTIMSTNKVVIEATETSSEDATTQPTLSDTAIADNAILTFYIDTVDTGGTGLGYTIQLYYTK